MSAVLPDPPVLHLPDEDPQALADAVLAVSGAASQLGVLGSHLTGPAATAPGWLGDDAVAAAAQIAAVAEVAREAHQALGEAASRLARHADLLAETRGAITAMRTEQEDDYAAASSRLADVLLHPAVPTAPSHPAVIVVLGDDLRTANAARLRRHGTLLAELHADAIETARVLVAASAAVGGSGRPGDGVRVVAALAARLPGWGDGELSARGAGLARTLLGPGTREELESRARAALPYAGSAAFADALLRVLGPDGFRTLLAALPVQGLESGSATARLLAFALGGAQRAGSVVDPVGEVFGARYVRERAPGTDDDLVALGLATVLAAAAPSGPGAIPSATVARWGGQMLRREQWWRAVTPAAARARDRAGPMYAEQPDPVVEVVRFLAASGDQAASAVLLGDAAVWKALLGRPVAGFPDAGAALRQIVQLAGSAPGPHGEAAVHAGLTALGTGLADGDPDHWPADRATADALAFPLAQAVGSHPGTAAGVLLAAGAARAPVTGGTDAALRGLGYLSIDAGAAAVVQTALGRWGRDHAGALIGGAMPVAPVVVGSYVAVREYGQRLAYALHGFRMRDEAELRQGLWNWTAGLLLNVALPKWYADIGGAVEPFVAHLVGADGTWDNGRDTGLVFGREDAAAVAEVELSGPSGEAAGTIGAAAATAFGRAGQVLGLPLPPESPQWSWVEAAIDAVPMPELRLVVVDGHARVLGKEAH